LTFGHFCPLITSLNREQLIRELRKEAKARGLEFRFDKKRGKGSHGTIHFGDRKMTCPKGELKTGLVKAIKKQLGVE